MKSIKEIANNAGFGCEIDRHGCYTNYELKKGDRVLRIEYTAPRKNLRSGYLFMANGPINCTITGSESFEFPYPNGIFTHALSKNGEWFYLTIEQVEELVNNN